jgi:hypothetical protein
MPDAGTLRTSSSTVGSPSSPARRAVRGCAVARRLAAAGARVVAGDALTDELAGLADELGDAVFTGALDVRDAASWDRRRAHDRRRSDRGHAVPP